MNPRGDASLELWLGLRIPLGVDGGFLYSLGSHPFADSDPCHRQHTPQLRPFPLKSLFPRIRARFARRRMARACLRFARSRAALAFCASMDECKRIRRATRFSLMSMFTSSASMPIKSTAATALRAHKCARVTRGAFSITRVNPMHACSVARSWRGAQSPPANKSPSTTPPLKPTWPSRFAVAAATAIASERCVDLRISARHNSNCVALDWRRTCADCSRLMHLPPRTNDRRAYTTLDC